MVGIDREKRERDCILKFVESPIFLAGLHKGRREAGLQPQWIPGREGGSLDGLFLNLSTPAHSLPCLRVALSLQPLVLAVTKGSLENPGSFP